MPNEADKTIKFSISMPASCAAKLESEKGKESRSSYISRLIQNGASAPTPSNQLLENLYQHYTPLLADDIAGIIEKHPTLNQPRILNNTLDALYEYLVYHYEGQPVRLALLPDDLSNKITLGKAAEDKSNSYNICYHLACN